MRESRRRSACTQRLEFVAKVSLYTLLFMGNWGIAQDRSSSPGATTAAAPPVCAGRALLTKYESANGFAEAQPSVLETVVNNECAAFEAVKRRDKTKYSDLMADEMIVISVDAGRFDKKEALKSFDSEALSDYSLKDVRGVEVTKDVVLLTYTLYIKTSLAGKPHQEDCLVSSLWANRGGVWKNVLYQETSSK